MSKWADPINRIIKIMLDLADIADEKEETPFDDEMGLGYCTFSKVVRKGIIEIINLISEYYSAVKRAEQANNSLKINEEFLTEIFGTKDIADYQLSDDEKSRIKAVVKEIQEKWESED